MEATSDPRAARAFLFSAGAVALAFALQVEWLESAAAHFVLFCGIAVAVGFAAWIYGSTAVQPEPLPPAEDVAPARGTAYAVVAPGVILLVALALLYRDLRSTTAAWLWLAGVLGVIGAVAWRERGGARSRARSDDRRQALAALALVVFALGVRVYRLEQVPGELVDDEALIAEWGMHIVHGTPLWDGAAAERTTVFRKGGAAEPMLGCVVHAAVMAVAGENTFGLRFTAALAGAIGVGLLYLLLREFLRPGAALGAAFLLAVCHTHLYWTRSGMLQALVTMVATGVMLGILRGLRSTRYLPWVVAGALLGLAQHLYEGGRFLVPILAPFLLIAALLDRGFVARHWRHVAAMAAMSVAVFAPLGFWYLQDPQSVLAVTKGAFIFEQPEYLESRYAGLSTIEIILEQLRKSLHGFAVRGDGGTFYPIWKPLFDPVLRALVLAGIAGFTLTRRAPYVLVSLWLWVPIAIACTVTVDPPPMSRLMLATPALFAVAGGMLDRLGALAERGFGVESSRLTTAIGAALLAAAALWNLDLFFVRFPALFPVNALTFAARAAANAGEGYKVYFVGSERLSATAPTVRFLARGVPREDLPVDALPVQELGGRGGLFLVDPGDTPTGEDPPALIALKDTYPGGETQAHHADNGELLFFSYRVVAAELASRVDSDEAFWREPALRFGWSGNEPGEMLNGRGLATDDTGSVYVADTGNRRVDVFGAGGESRATLYGTADTAVGAAFAVARENDGNLVVLNRKLRRLRRFSAGGAPLANVGEQNLFADPVGVAAAPDGTLVVLDSARPAVVRLARDGKEIGRVGEPGSAPGQFAEPAGIAVAPDGRVYVADQGNGRIQRFSPALTYEAEWPVPPSGHDAGQVIAATDDAVYLIDAENHRLLRYATDGRKQWNVGGGGLPPNHLAWPTAVTTDSRGRVYVLDDERGSIYRFDVK